MVLLTEFGKLSGYSVNIQKSEVLPVGTSNNEIFLNSLPFKLCPKKFKYLGIWVTDKHKELYAANYQICISISLKALLCFKLPFTQPFSNFTSNPIVLHFVKIWNQFRRFFLLTDLSQATPVAENHMLTPLLMDEVFDGWSRGGIASLSDLYVDGHFASFDQLVQQYHIPSSHFYRYL